MVTSVFNFTAIFNFDDSFFFFLVDCNIQDENATKRGGIGDIRELKRVYHVYRDYFTRNNKAFDLEQR